MLPNTYGVLCKRIFLNSPVRENHTGLCAGLLDNWQPYREWRILLEKEGRQ
jgi:hypothetical protein